MINKKTDLSDIGFLQTESSYVNCPACEQTSWSVVCLEAVTCLQRLLNFTKLCNFVYNFCNLSSSKKWRGRNDINHYCSKCGCYIGRFAPLGCYERCISRAARRQAAVDEMTLKRKPRDCATTMQKAREHVLAKRAQKRAELEAQRQTQQT